VLKNTQYFAKYKENPLLFKTILEQSKEGAYYALPETDVSEIIDFAKNVKKTNIALLGIGGSALGARAVYNFLKYSNKFSRSICFLESTDPVLLNASLEKIDLEDTLFLLISKSGSTIETMSIFKYLLSKLELSKENFAFISDKDSPLDKLAQKHKISFFEIPKNVGGRFSVLSAVGLVPLALLGVDIKALLRGAKEVKDEFFSCGEIYTKLISKARFYVKNSNKININCLFSYSEVFRSFNAWYVQLWGESLGKKQIHSDLNVGLTPIGLIGPSDQHSFLQLIMQGKRDKSVSFIKIGDFKSKLEIPDINIEFNEDLNFINSLTFSKLINLQADSIIQSLKANADIALDILEIPRVDEPSIGMLFYYYELLTSLVAILFDINAYNQPGVEDGKKILRSYFD